MSPGLPSKGGAFRFLIKAAAIAGGILKGGGTSAIIQRAFTWFAITNQGVGAYDAWRQSKSLQEQSTTAKHQGTQVNSTASESALPIVYGRTKIGLKIIDIRQKVIGTNADATYTISVTGAICVAAGGGNATAERGIAGVAGIFLDEEEAIFGASATANNGAGNPTNSGMKADGSTRWWGGTVYTSWGLSYYLRYMLHTGNQTAVDYFLNNQHSNVSTAGGAWGTQTIGKGISYITLWMFYDTTAYPNALPNITMEVNGNIVPNVSNLALAQAFSVSPPKCIYDFMTSKTYGMGIAGFDMDTASFSAAVTYCDATITIAGASGTITTQARYTCNGALNSGESPMANLEKMLTSCNGRIVYENGKYSLKLRKATAPETFQLDETNIVGDWSFKRAGIDETPNSIKVTYIDTALNFQPQTITWPYPDDANPYLVEDGGLLNEMSVELPFTTNEYMAVMLASQILLENREDVTCTLTAQREALKLTVGSVVEVSHSTTGWDEKEMSVEAISLRADGLVEIALKEFNDDTYDLPVFKTAIGAVASNLPKAYASGTAQAPTVGPF